VVRLQLLFFVHGSCTGALAGWMIAHWGGVLGTDSFSVDLAIGLFLMVVLGGITTHWGAVIGALFYVEVPQYLKQFTRYQSVIYGAVLLVVIIALPKGLAGLAESVFHRRRVDSPLSPEATAARGRFARLLGVRGD
jgi:branched-chain amino acid transport system permease protein